jgi:CubicO group peptidase (beta-lactamase class C family)
MPLLGWSMAKTALNALVGMLAKDGAWAVEDEELLPQWRNDGRRGISLDQLLRMTSGLDFDADDNNERMLFTVGDIGAFAASKPLAAPPGTAWQYSQGPSNVVALIMRRHFKDERAYLRFPRSRLFEPLGMRSAVLEPDAAGTFIGSTFMYASARDWARLGLLFLQDGVWQGQRLLPEGWVRYTTTPTAISPGKRYGAHVWLRLPDSENLGVPPMPEDAYYMLGYDQQIVAMIPSRDLVIVRLGLTRKTKAFDHAQALAPIIAAFPPHAD